MDDRAWPAGCPDGPQKYEPNEFGTDEFVRFCRLVGGQPYLAGNVRSLTAQGFRRLDRLLQRAGRRHHAGGPARGGRRGAIRSACASGASATSPGAAAAISGPRTTRRNTGGSSSGCRASASACRFVASGPNGGDVEWTRRFFANMAERRSLGSVWGWALHHYSWNVSGGRTSDWNAGKGSAVGYPVEEWYELLEEAGRVERLILDHWAAMAEMGPAAPREARRGRVGRVVPGRERGGPDAPVRPAVHHARRRARRARRSTSSTATRTRWRWPTSPSSSTASTRSSSRTRTGSWSRRPTTSSISTRATRARRRYASSRWRRPRRTRPVTTRCGWRGSRRRRRCRGRQVTLTVTNPDTQTAREASIGVRGAAIARAAAIALTAPSIQAVNTFDAPGQVRPRDAEVAQPRDGRFAHTFPPASVTRLQLDLV